MAIAKEMNWYIRAGGAETNGGGYDGTNYPGGVNYADQDSPQLSITDLTSTNSTTVTSVLSTFTANMVGNVLRLASGTGTVPGYYVIVAFVNSAQVTLDSVSGTYTAGVAKVGGAHHQLWVYANGGAGTQPVISTPLVAGNTIYMRGAGSNDPAVNSPDYTIDDNTYWTYPNGSTVDGHIKLIGYNGRPEILSGGLYIYVSSFWVFENLKFVYKPGNSSYIAYGFFYTSTALVRNCIFDQNGQDATLIGTDFTKTVIDCEFRNSGGGAIGGQPLIFFSNYASTLINSWVHGGRGAGINLSSPSDYIFTIQGNIIANNNGDGIFGYNTIPGAYLSTKIFNNTIDANSGNGIYIQTKESLMGVYFMNNIISNHTTSGKYGINVTGGSASGNDRWANGKFDYNNYYNNYANYNNLSTGLHDLSVDPQYTNAAGNNYSVGTNLKAKGYPLLPIGFSGTSSATQSYVDIGAAQRQETSTPGGGEHSSTYVG